MKDLMVRISLGGLLALGLGPALADRAPAAAAKDSDVLLTAMQQELQRAQGALGKLDPPPYFMSYGVYDQSVTVAVGIQGGLVNFTDTHARPADVVVRVGAPALDNTHEGQQATAISSGAVPLADDADAITHALWQLTYGEYRKASQAYLNTKTKTQVNAKEEDTSPDFSVETSLVHADHTPLPPAPDPE